MKIITFFPDIEEKKKPKRQLAPTFKPYNNYQVQVIFDIESHIPENHVARVVDEMVDAVPDKQLFAHYTGDGRSSFHPKMMLKIIEFGIVALAHNILKVAGFRQLLSEDNQNNSKTREGKRHVFLHGFYFWDLSDSPFSFFLTHFLFFR